MKNFILKSITAVMAVMFLISVCYLDLDSWIPTIVCAISISWCGIFVYANERNFEEGE